MRLYQLKLLIFFPLIFFISCSVELLNFQKDYDNLHLNVINEDVWFDDDSLRLVKTTTTNFSTSTEKEICNLSNDITSEEKSFWSFLNLFQSDQGNVRYYSDYPLSFNNDSSLALLVTDDITNKKEFIKHLILINIKNCITKKILKISSPNNYISERIPFSTYINTNNFIDHNEIFLYFVGNPAKWLDRNNFIVCTNDSVIMFNTDSINNPKYIMKADINSNYQVADSLIINQSSQNIELINFRNQTKSILFDEDFTTKLNKTQKYVYFIKGWSLYRCSLQNLDKPEKIFKGENTLKDYLIINDSTFIICNGRLTDVPESNKFYLFDLNKNETTYVNETTKLTEYYLTTDKKYFIIEKKTIQISTYRVLVVFDIENKRKYEFDMETIH